MTRYWILLAAGTFAVAWFNAAATAIRVTSRIWMRDWVERGGRGAAAFRTFLERPQRLIAVAAAAAGLVLLGVGAALQANADGDARRWAAGFLVAIVVLAVFGQAVPRAVARRWSTTLAPVLVTPLQLLDAATAPLRPDRGEAAAGATLDPFQELLREGLLEGVGSREEIATIATIVSFAERRVGQVMTPRAEIFALDESLPAETLAERIATAKYTRVPIYRGSIDEVVGMVHAFDLLKQADGVTPLRLRPVAVVEPQAPCNELLFRMLRAGRQLAIVRDAQERTVGLVTLEDLLEELVGEIRDEHDEPAWPTGPGLR